MTHVAPYKKKIVQDFVNALNEYPIVGALDVESLPAAQLQKIRAKLRGRFVIKMTKRKFIKLALEQVKEKKKGIEELENHLKGMPALIFSKENPFLLGKILRESKSKAPAKPGQTAPNDIEIKAGPTPFMPGPIIGELGAIGLKTSVEAGKVVINFDKLVVREGEKIPANIADILTRLGIEPMEVGLSLNAVYENGIIYEKDILSIDEQTYIDMIRTSASEAFNLAVFSRYLTKETTEFLVKKAFNEAKSLALSREIISDVVLEKMIVEAERAMLNLKKGVRIEEKEIGKKEKIAETEKEKVSKEKKEIKEEISKKEEILPEKITQEPKLGEIKEADKIEVKAEVTEEDMKKAEEFIKELQKKGFDGGGEASREAEDLPSVNELVEKMKRFAKEGKGPSSEKILESAEEEKLPSLQELAKQAKRREMEKRLKEVPSAHDLAKKMKEK